MRHGFSQCDDSERGHRTARPGQEFKKLPEDGLWTFYQHLALNTSDEDVQKFFREVGLEIPLDHIVVVPRQGRARAMVSIPYSQILYMLNYFIDGRPLFDAPMVANLSRHLR
jgi:hypothetical protein